MIQRRKITWSLDVEKAFNKFQHPFMIKTGKLGREGNFLSLIKNIYKKPTANIILSQRLNAHPQTPKIRTKARTPTLTTPSHHHTRSTHQCIQTGKEKIKLSLFSKDIILHLKNSNKSTKSKQTPPKTS